MSRLRGFLGGLTPAALTGAFFLLALGRLTPMDGPRAPLLLAGGLVGVGVVALIRLFRVARWAYPLAGLLAGPVPFALLMGRDAEGDDRAGVWVASAVLGILIGTIEWAREARPERGSS